ncbi:MAG TPA: hypothetical protein VJN96_20885 [Vicinamibacterales bacterium]|nr:hypothetical protein [Vicinamibacterales bacterium]
MNEVDFIRRNRLFSPAEVLVDSCSVPRASGVDAWFFREIPPRVPTVGCLQREGLTLLYVGISPQKGTPTSFAIAPNAIDRKSQLVRAVAPSSQDSDVTKTM